MGIANKIAHKAEAVKGGAKRIVGRVTGQPAPAGRRPR